MSLKIRRRLTGQKKMAMFWLGKILTFIAAVMGSFFVEADWNGKVVRQFNLGRRPYRVTRKILKDSGFIK